MAKTSATLQSYLQTPSTILLLDGGTSTALENILQSKQPQPQNFPDRNLWSSSLLLSPTGQKDIQQSHEAFYNAGSDIVTTVTYQLSRYACRYGYDEDVIDGLLHKAVEIAKDAADAVSTTRAKKRERYVVASLGCYGAVLADGSEYTGKYGNEMSVEELVGFHEKRVRVLFNQEGGTNGERGRERTPMDLDGIAFETIPCLQEVKAIIKAVKSAQPNVFVWLSLACKDEKTLNDGTPILDVLQVVDEMDPDGKIIQGIGVNCCKVKFIHELSQSIAKHVLHEHEHIASNKCTRRVVVLYPNSGEEWVAENETWLEGSGCTNAEDYAMEMIKCIRGIHDLCDERKIPRLSILVGGCCRTSPLMIEKLRAAVDEYVSCAL